MKDVLEKQRVTTTSGGGRERVLHYTEWLVLLRGLARRYKNLVTRIGKAEMNATFIEYELFQLLKMMEDGLPDSREAELPFAQASSPDASTRSSSSLRYLAEAGAAALKIQRRPDGSGDVRIDGGKQFNLPPALADLMHALSEDNGRSTDSFVGWKALSEIVAILAEKTGKEITKHAVTQNIYRIRKQMFDRGGVNPYLIQTNRRLGVRFALRRTGELPD